MSQMFHIVKKDLRRLRWWLAGWIALLASRAPLMMAEARTASEGFAQQFLLDQFDATVAALTLVMLGLLIARLVHEEPLVGLDWFWLTRPYDRYALLGAKLLISAVFFVVLPLATELVVMAMFDAGPRDMMRAGSVFLARDVRWTLGLMAMAVLTPSLVMFAIGFVGSVAALALAMMMMVAIALLTLDEETPPIMSAGDPTPAVVATVMFAVTSLAVIVYQYRRRRLARALVLLAAGAIAVAIVATSWPWSFARPRRIDPGAWAQDAGRVAASIDRSEPVQISNELTFGRRRDSERQVSVPAPLTGLPPDYRIQDVFAESRLEFPDGHVLQSRQRSGARLVALDGGSYTGMNALQGALGDVRLPSIGDREPVPLATLLTIADEELARYSTQVGRLTATLHYTLERSRMIGALPFAEGAALDGDSMRIEIIRFERRRDGCALVLRQWHVSSVLSASEYRQYDFVLRNTDRREAFTGDSRWISRDTFSLGPFFLAGFTLERAAGQGFAVRYLDVNYPMQLPGQSQRATIDAAWLSGADLAVVETAYAGQITRTVTVEDFRIEEP